MSLATPPVQAMNLDPAHDNKIIESTGIVPRNGMDDTIDKIQDAIESVSHPPSEDEQEDFGIGSDARARLAAQAKLANDQRDLQRISGGVAGLVYSDESEDEDEEALRSPIRHGRKSVDDSGKQPSHAQVGQILSMPPSSSIRSASDVEGNLQPSLPVSSTPPLFVAQPMGSSGAGVNTWGIEQVVAWAESKGFEDSICAKFRGKLKRQAPD